MAMDVYHVRVQKDNNIERIGNLIRSGSRLTIRAIVENVGIDPGKRIL